MKSSYAVQTVDDPRVRLWFKKVDKRLRNGQGVLVRGAACHVGGGLYAVSVETVVDSFAFTAWPAFFMLGGVAAALIWRNIAVAGGLIWIGIAALFIIYGIMSPNLHRFIIRVTLRRLTGRWVSVKLATSEAVRRLAYGEI